jgi:hypothetical protein
VSSSSDFEEAEKSSTAVESDSTSRTSNLAVRLERKLLGLVVLVLVRPREGERPGEVAARIAHSICVAGVDEEANPVLEEE